MIRIPIKWIKKIISLYDDASATKFLIKSKKGNILKIVVNVVDDGHLGTQSFDIQYLEDDEWTKALQFVDKVASECSMYSSYIADYANSPYPAPFIIHAYCDDMHGIVACIYEVG